MHYWNFLNENTGIETNYNSNCCRSNCNISTISVVNNLAFAEVEAAASVLCSKKIQ